MVIGRRISEGVGKAIYGRTQTIISLAVLMTVTGFLSGTLAVGSLDGPKGTPNFVAETDCTHPDF